MLASLPTVLSHRQEERQSEPPGRRSGRRSEAATCHCGGRVGEQPVDRAEPVVHVSFYEAAAYAAWAGKRLPTESEWEFAARGGLSGKTYAWGNELRPGGKWMANIYEGQFPVKDTGADGFAGLAPVAQFPPNGYGLYDMAGNVWQWCSDWYRPDTYAQLKAAGGVARNPQGPDSSSSPDDDQPERVQRGGSFLCTDQYCTRYMMGTRGKGDVDTGSNHVGFRCIMTK